MELYAFGDQGHAFDFLFDGHDSCRLSQLASQELGETHRTLDAAVDRLAALGIEPVVVNMTTEDAEACNLAVVKVLAPPCDLLEGDQIGRAHV
mgnify:CR=1 FL=1